MGMVITGLSEVQRMLREAPRNLVTLGFIRATSAGGNVIARELEIRTPVKAEDTGGLLDKGELREAISIRYKLDSKLQWASASTGFFGKNTAAVADWIEYGHVMLGHLPGKKFIKHVPAYPFMRPAAEAAFDPTLDAVAKSLSATVRQIFPQPGYGASFVKS